MRYLLDFISSYCWDFQPVAKILVRQLRYLNHQCRPVLDCFEFYWTWYLGWLAGSLNHVIVFAGTIKSSVFGRKPLLVSVRILIGTFIIFSHLLVSELLNASSGTAILENIFNGSNRWNINRSMRSLLFKIGTHGTEIVLIIRGRTTMYIFCSLTLALVNKDGLLILVLTFQERGVSPITLWRL